MQNSKLMHSSDSMTEGGAGRRAKGFTLLELMITLVVVSVLLTLAVPGMRSFFDGKRLIDATEQVYSHIQQARMEAIARSAPMFVNFSADGSTSWQYGVSTNATCDLTTTTATDTNACVIAIDDGDGTVDPGDGTVDAGDLVLMRFSDADHVGISMSIITMTTGTDIGFDSVRGTAEAADIKLISAGGKQLTIRVGIMGRVRICSQDGSVPQYSTTDCI